MTPAAPFDHPSFTPAELGRVEAGEWRARAACAAPHLEPANWFPERSHAKDLATRNALVVCGGCPVQGDCLVFALINDGHRDRGIYGGLTAKARTALRARLQDSDEMPVIRVCANPACRRQFPVLSIHVPRHNVCCSDRCRMVRRRLAARDARLRRAS